MNKRFKLTTLAGAIALAMGSTAAYAAAPAATQLPGQGKIVSGTVTAGTPTAGGVQTITLGSNAVIDWGNGTDINKTGVAGFNIGSAASLTFDGTGAVLNVDVSGNASQIFGSLASTAGNLYVANANGIIVGAGATITASGAEVGLIGNVLGPTGTFTGNITSVGYNGTGGDVTVAAGADLSGGTVLISGGNVVNVDLGSLTGGNATLSAGLPNTGGAFADTNPAASLAVSGALGGATLTSFASAGDASSSGTLNLGANAMIAGTLTNTGTMDLGSGFAIDGAVVNNKTMTQSGAAEADGGLTNAGTYDGGNNSLTVGGLVNNAKMTNMGYVKSDGGDFVNNGTFDSPNSYNINTYGGGNFTNNGEITGVYYVDIYEGGDFTNAGTMSLDGSVYVVNGSITNSGKLSVDYYLETASDSTDPSFTAGADYSITNTGTVTGATDLVLSANSDYWGDHNGAGNDSTGSVTNTGVLQLGSGYELQLQAYNDVTLAGTVQAFNGTKYAALSAGNSLDDFSIYAGDFDGSVFNTDGVATLATDIVTDGSNDNDINGTQVRLMANFSMLDAAGNPAGGEVDILAGAAPEDGYAVRVAAGKTITAEGIDISGDKAANNPNVILQGTLAASSIWFGDFAGEVSDVFSGPNGGLVMWGNPYLDIEATGRVKTAPYLNDANNFRYNYLPITVTDGSTLDLEIDPSNMTGVPTSGLNLLVNGDVDLSSDMAAFVHANGTAVTGVTNIPNSHLVLQSTGNIEVGDGGDFYWPGYIYLGNIAMDADGNALPGTLGLGTITTDGEFNNVLPGDIAGASGIHFITQFPMTIGGNVVTNANAWVNFGTALLTEAYSTGTLPGDFYGGTKGSGTVVNYGPLAPENFVTQPPVSEK